MYVLNVYEIRDKQNEKSNVAPLGAQKHGESGLGQKAGFASVQRFAQKEPSQRKNLRLARGFSKRKVKNGSQESQEGCMGTVGLGKENNCVPRGFRLTANGCN
jgi:hypothetical protein